MQQGGVALDRSLGALQLWGIAVGLVISGEYFGWNFGWGLAGTLGFLVTTLVIAAMYLAFVFSYTELTTAIPQAGGPFVYGHRAFGPMGGAIAGFATLIEFLFAGPAVALAIGAYLHLQFPDVGPRAGALGAYLLFMGVNIVGVRTAATIELVVTLLAVAELLVFMGVVAPGFSWARFSADGWSGHGSSSSGALGGMIAATPFAIWFFLGIEGLAMTAEEARAPHCTIPIAYVGGMLVLTLLALGVMVLAGGAGDWRTLTAVDDPLPKAMTMVVGSSSGWLRLLVWLGLFGLVASFQGTIMAFSRQGFALARAGYLPAAGARLHRRFHTPHVATLAGGAIGIAAIFGDRLVVIAGQTLTASIVTLSAFGALLTYVVAMGGLFRLRRLEPALERPYRTPLYPLTPLAALLIAGGSLVTMAWFNPALFAIFVGLLGAAVAASLLSTARRAGDRLMRGVEAPIAG